MNRLAGVFSFVFEDIKPYNSDNSWHDVSNALIHHRLLLEFMIDILQKQIAKASLSVRIIGNYETVIQKLYRVRVHVHTRARMKTSHSDEVLSGIWNSLLSKNSTYVTKQPVVSAGRCPVGLSLMPFLSIYFSNLLR